MSGQIPHWQSLLYKRQNCDASEEGDGDGEGDGECDGEGVYKHVGVAITMISFCQE